MRIALDLLALVVNEAAPGCLHEAIELAQAVADIEALQTKGTHGRNLRSESMLHFDA